MTAIDRQSGALRPDLEYIDPQARRQYLDGKVAAIVAHAFERAPAFARRMADAGLTPADIGGVDDLARLPLLRKSDLVELQKKAPPFGGLSHLTTAGLRRVYVSPGPIYEPAENNLADDRWAQAFYAAGFRPGDLCQVSFNFNLAPFAFWLDESLRQLGCACLPAGVGNGEIQVRAMKDLGVTGYLGTPSFLATLADKAEEMGLDPRRDLSLAVGFVAAEMLPESLRQSLEERFGMIVRQSYGTADVGCLSYECRHLGGMHLAQGCLTQIVDPDTGLPLGPGQPGEVAATVFNPAYPLIRFATGDLSFIDETPCPCGRTSAKLGRIMGRVDQMTKVKGMFVHPGGVRQVVEKFPQVAAYQLVVERQGHNDVLTLVCEVEDDCGGHDELKARMAAAMKDILRLSGEVRLQKPGGLAPGRKVIDDRRKWD